MTENINIESLVYNKCSEDELLNFIKLYQTDNKFIKFILFSDLYKYIAENALVNVCNELILREENYRIRILTAICKYTDNVDLYKQCCYDGIYNFLLFGHICSSLLYDNKPSQLTKYILEKYYIDGSTNVDAGYFFLIFDLDHDTNFNLIMFVIDEFNSFFALRNKYRKLFKILNEDRATIIIMKILDNTLACYDEAVEEAFKIILSKCSISNIKIFNEKYITDVQILISNVHKIKDYDIFIYFLNIVGPEGIILENFNDEPNGDYKIIQWLIINGFKIRPDFDFFNYNYSMNNYEIIMLIIQDAALNNDMEYLYDNTSGIIQEIINYDLYGDESEDADNQPKKSNGESLKIFNIIPINILNQNKIFKKATKNKRQDLLNLLI